MRYIDIKNQVITTSTSLHLPDELVELYLTKQWELRDLYFHSWDIRGEQHPSIKSLVHAMMHYDSRRYWTVQTVLVDDVPAFFYIKGGREGSDYFHGYILDKDATKQYIKYMAVVALGKWITERTGFLPEYLPEVTDENLVGKYWDWNVVSEGEEISELNGRGSIQYRYGTTYKRVGDYRHDDGGYVDIWVTDE